MKDNEGRDINYLRISVTELCDLRCRYCMPEKGVEKKSHDSIMRIEELIDAAKAAVSLGIKKIRITGGEPLVRRGIVDLCREIGKIEGLEELCMTTNGILLSGVAQQLREAGISRINISIDTLKEDKYRYVTRCGDIKNVFEGIRAAEKAGMKIKLNVVLMKGFNDDEIEDFVRLTEEKDMEVRFIELMPIGEGSFCDSGNDEETPEGKKYQFRYADSAMVLEKMPELEEAGFSGVAKLYRLPGARGRVGLIRTLSCDFCSSCNKIRLTADGWLKPCLHLGGETRIKGLNEEEMRKVMAEVIRNKPARRDEMNEKIPSKAGRPMNEIGG